MLFFSQLLHRTFNQVSKVSQRTWHARYPIVEEEDPTSRVFWTRTILHIDHHPTDELAYRTPVQAFGVIFLLFIDPDLFLLHLCKEEFQQHRWLSKLPYHLVIHTIGQADLGSRFFSKIQGYPT